MADIAMIFHWSPADMNQMTLAELVDWHSRARVRFEMMQKAGINV